MIQSGSRRAHFQGLAVEYSLACEILPHSRMMISTQMSGPCYPGIHGIPRTGTFTKSPVVSLSPLRRRVGLIKVEWSSGFRKGSGRSTWATEQPSSLPFSSSAEDASDGVDFAEAAEDHASDGGVPAKDTNVRDSPGTKIVKFMDPTSSPKLVSIIDDHKLPPLLSMIINGLPPMQQSKHVNEAKKRLHQYVERYPNVISLNSYCHIGLSSASYGYPKVINVDRLVAISINYALLFVVDDLFFDTPNEFLQDQYGISHNACGSSKKIQVYLNHLNAVFGQQVQPSNPAPLIETMMWESGRDMLELSNPKWFGNFVACVMEHYNTGVTSHADIVEGHSLWFQDLKSYTTMRSDNVGGKFMQLMIEFAKDMYIPSIVKANPYLENITTATSIHLGFVNDIFSYHKESSLEQNPRNLITVLMKCEGKPFVQTVHMAIDLINTYAQAILDLESQAWNSTLQNYLQDIKALIAGGVYFGCIEKRYRHPDSVFLELRDMQD